MLVPGAGRRCWCWCCELDAHVVETVDGDGSLSLHWSVPLVLSKNIVARRINLPRTHFIPVYVLGNFRRRLSRKLLVTMPPFQPAHSGTHLKTRRTAFKLQKRIKLPPSSMLAVRIV